MPKIKIEFKVVHKTDEVFNVKQVRKIVDNLQAALPIVQEALQSPGLQRLTVQEFKEKAIPAPKHATKAVI
jgi:hypothetical protein